MTLTITSRDNRGATPNSSCGSLRVVASLVIVLLRAIALLGIQQLQHAQDKRGKE
jgi:hypothetical protein